MKSCFNNIIKILAVAFLIITSFVVCSDMVYADPVYTDSIKNGQCQIEVISDEVNVKECKLENLDDQFTVTITLNTNIYDAFFDGMPENAGDNPDIIYGIETEEGFYSFEIPVDALNVKKDYSLYNTRKEEWQEWHPVFLADSIPARMMEKVISSYSDSKESEEADIIESQAKAYDESMTPVKTEKADGNYTIEVELKGGSGRASITSPARVEINDSKITAFIEWSSSNYDYMIVNGETYYPEEDEENSVFAIPVYALDSEFTVVADTTAMSKPHEIEYTLLFKSETLSKVSGTRDKIAVVLIVMISLMSVVFAATLTMLFLKIKKGLSANQEDKS